MAEDLNYDAVPNVVRNDSSSDSTTEPGTRTVPPTVRQTDEDVNNYISVTCEENEHDDDEHLSIQSGAAFENRETVHISPGDFDTYAIAYTCKEHDTRIKKNVEETKSEPFQGSKTTSSSHNKNDIHLTDYHIDTVENDVIAMGRYRALSGCPSGHHIGQIANRDNNFGVASWIERSALNKTLDA
ncbi:hypothetical protein Bbelb_072670 [Branchiostoma belcheri]|nr:hypothetical protein Bbelb_072670 [Branchiostoma belcheri]